MPPGSAFFPVVLRARIVTKSVMIKTSVVVAMILVFAAPCRSTSAQTALVQALPAQTAANRYQQKLQPVLEKLIHEQQVPGFAISVVEDNRVVYAAAFGVKNVTRSDDPITTRSLFHMASITKTFVATSIMQLVEAGKIDLDAPLVKYLPYFRMADERYKIITIRQMVTHTSGIPDVDDYEWSKPQYDDGALERYVRSLSNLKLDFAPGQRFQYSNMAFEVLGDVIAKVSGESFDDYVQHHILAAGLDTFAVAPLAGLHPISSVILNVIENAPVPVADTDNIQVTRDVLDVLLDYCVHIAMFKCGGAEFQETIQLFDNFRKSAQAENKRIAGLGLYDDVVKSQGRRQELVDAR